MNEQLTNELPDELQLAIDLMSDHPYAAWDPRIEQAQDAVAQEHAQRVTLQHHAADLEQRVADLEAENSSLIAAMREEIDEGLRLRELGGAQPDEGITAMTERIIRERDELRARLAEIEAQEPAAEVRTWHKSGDQHADLIDWCDALYSLPDGDHKLYARPVTAQAAPGTKAARDVLAERRRQVEVEGWTPEHDDEAHLPGELAIAASCYCVADEDEAPPAVWPWDWSWWKPKSRRSNMVRAAALLLAEIERLDRASAPEHKA